MNKLLLLVLALLAPLTATAQTGLENGNAVDVTLPGNGFDFAVDDSRSLVYVSIPSTNQVLAISTLSFAVVGQMSPGGNPHGIDISGDGSTLYVALSGAGSVAVVDLGTFTLSSTLNVGSQLGHPSTWDVAEGMPGEVFVSANPGSGGFAYITRIDRNNGNQATRVAGNRIIRAGPTMRTSPDRTALYIGEGFSPNSLYRLDITQPTAPLVLEDNHGSVSGTQYTALHPLGDRIFLSSGQVLSTGSFNQLGTIGGGYSAISRDGSWAFAVPTSFGQGPDRVEVYDTTSLALAQTITLQCPTTAVAAVATLEQDRGVLVLSDDRICGRVLPGGSLCSLPGTGEDLQLLSQGNVLNCKEVDTADTITIQLRSPGGTFLGSAPILALQAYDAATTLFPSVPGLQLDSNQPSLVVTQVLSGPLGPFTLPPQGLTYQFQVAPAWALWTLRAQGVAFDPGAAANGVYATTDAHDLALVSGQTPLIDTVLPLSAQPGQTVTILGSQFDPGVEVTIDGVVVTPLIQTDTTILVDAPATLGCDTAIRLRNSGGRSTTVPFNPEPVVSSTINVTGPSAGGTPFVMLGSGFVGGLTATVGGVPATVVSNTSSSVVVLTPPGATGAAQVVVSAPNGCVVSAPFTYR
jgi:hypothetical protein